MKLSSHDLQQLDEAAVRRLTEETLRHLSLTRWPISRRRASGWPKIRGTVPVRPAVARLGSMIRPRTSPHPRISPRRGTPRRRRPHPRRRPHLSTHRRRRSPSRGLIQAWGSLLSQWGQAHCASDVAGQPGMGYHASISKK